MKVGDRVVMKKDTMPKSNFRTGVVVTAAPSSNGVRIKRDYYRGHEMTWWYKNEWKVMKRISSLN